MAQKQTIQTKAYYFYGDPYNTYLEQQKTGSDFGDVYVNCLEIFEFTLRHYESTPFLGTRMISYLSNKWGAVHFLKAGSFKIMQNSKS